MHLTFQEVGLYKISGKIVNFSFYPLKRAQKQKKPQQHFTGHIITDLTAKSLIAEDFRHEGCRCWLPCRTNYDRTCDSFLLRAVINGVSGPSDEFEEK